MTPILDVTSVTRPPRLPHRVSLRLDAGDRHAAVTPAATGTALLDLIVALDTPTSGTIRVAGRRVIGTLRAEYVRDQIGYLRAIPHRYTAPTVFAVLASTARAHRMSRRRPSGLTDTEQANAVLERLDLADDRDTPHDRLPPGRRPLLDLAAQLSRRPILLLLDQPLNGLTPNDRDVLVQVLDDLPETTAVLSTAATQADAAAIAANISELGHLSQTGHHAATGRTPVNGTRPDLPFPRGLPW